MDFAKISIDSKKKWIVDMEKVLACGDANLKANAIFAIFSDAPITINDLDKINPIVRQFLKREE